MSALGRKKVSVQYVYLEVVIMMRKVAIVKIVRFKEEEPIQRTLPIIGTLGNGFFTDTNIGSGKSKIFEN